MAYEAEAESETLSVNKKRKSAKLILCIVFCIFFPPGTFIFILLYMYCESTVGINGI